MPPKLIMMILKKTTAKNYKQDQNESNPKQKLCQENQSLRAPQFRADDRRIHFTKIFTSNEKEWINRLKEASPPPLLPWNNILRPLTSTTRCILLYKCSYKHTHTYIYECVCVCLCMCVRCIDIIFVLFCQLLVKAPSGMTRHIPFRRTSNYNAIQ